MKRPMLDQWQRLLVTQDTSVGHHYKLALAWAKLKREINREANKFIGK
jgi:hypothetical protein